ncbi:reverse transcriptase [Plakobranchus ocellatus]|uniref:Reverse transcriptase n=1 Tax=Plakobranchus ocellatus TaxID=259542 RepID=A0AAV4C2C2_9GAST|nr:reverse transcriptase [Plakobranchus ocellatus]
MRFSTEKYTTDWINLEVGISMGCTISQFLFILAMEVTLRAAQGSESPGDHGGRCYMPPLKVFVGNIIILCSNEKETCKMLVWLDALMNWSRMKFKPKRSRSLSIREGQLDEDACFKEATLDIPRLKRPSRALEDVRFWKQQAWI